MGARVLLAARARRDARGGLVVRRAWARLLGAGRGSLRCLAALAAVGTAAPAPRRRRRSPPAGRAAGAAPATYRHVIVIMEENKSITDVLGGAGSAAARQAPYLNHLAAVCGVADELPRRHPSQPPQLHGDHRRRRDDGDQRERPEHLPPGAPRGRDLARLRGLDAAGVPAHAPPSRTSPSTTRASPTPRSRTTASGGTRTGRALAHDIATGGLPAYAFIAPDQCKDMEIGCGGDERHHGGRQLAQDLDPATPAHPRLPHRPHGDLHHLGRGRTRATGTTGENCLAPANLQRQSAATSPRSCSRRT